MNAASLLLENELESKINAQHRIVPEKLVKMFQKKQIEA